MYIRVFDVLITMRNVHLFQISSFDSLIKNIDRCTGVAKCRDVITRLDYLHDDQVHTSSTIPVFKEL